MKDSEVILTRIRFPLYLSSSVEEKHIVVCPPLFFSFFEGRVKGGK